MKMTKRILATATAALTVTAALAGCTGGTSSTTSTAAPSQADANKELNASITEELIRMKEAEARLKHGWVEVQGADAVVTEQKNK